MGGQARSDEMRNNRREVDIRYKLNRIVCFPGQRLIALKLCRKNDPIDTLKPST